MIRLLLNHSEAEIVFANSESNAGNLVSDVHEGLIGETDLRFTDEMPFDQVDVIFFCFGHGKSEAFLKEHTIPENVKIIDLAQDFRIKGDHDYVYGLPEINKAEIQKAQHVANPGCFATCIQLGLLPAAKLGLLKYDVAVNAITGSTGAGQKPGATTHFSWRNNNLSIYKPFTHQHLAEIRQSLIQTQGSLDIDIDFIPYRGDFARGIFCTEVIRTKADANKVIQAYKDFYRDAAFTHYSDQSLDLKQVVNTNKCLVHIDAFDNKLLVTSCIDNLLKGADYSELKESYVIFICVEDPFAEGLPVYSFERACRENPEVQLDDRTHHVIFNASAYEKEENSELKDFLSFVKNNNAESEFTRGIAKMVQAKKFEQTFLNEYMAWNLHEHDVERRGKLQLAADLIKSGLLSIKDAAAKLGMTEAELRTQI